MERLDRIILEGRQAFLTNSARLVARDQRRGPLAPRGTARVTPEAIFEWLMGVRCTVSNSFGNLHAARGSGEKRSNTYAIAYLRRQEVRFNPSFIDDEERYTDADLLDMVLHELGHLFAWHFWRDRGHGADWQYLGWIIGYVPLGGTPIAKRRAIRDGQMLSYRMAAATGTTHPTLGV